MMAAGLRSDRRREEMFRIGVMELVLTCGIALLALLIPIVIVWLYKRVDHRLRNLENRSEKGSKE
jgi:uncharacterized membrane protein